MRENVKVKFKTSMMNNLAPLGYIVNSGTVFARQIDDGILGCIGYIISNARGAVKIFVGVRFERVERIYDDLMRQFEAIPKSTSYYFPSVFRDLYELKKERHPDAMIRESSYFHIDTHDTSRIVDHLIVDIKEYGITYIDYNSTLERAASTIIQSRGGGIGTVAYRLPIIYWILGRTEEAKEYLANILTKQYPIGPYDSFASLLIARMDAGPAPLPPGVH
jgi:hypothetical protein